MSGIWAQVWPNILADIIWLVVFTPAGWLFHRLVKQTLADHRAEQAQMHLDHQAEVRKIVSGEVNSDGT